MAVVGEVRTPTLVMHSELDFRCPLEQATRYYAALKRNGVEAEMLIFPGENHELSRAGKPRHRVRRLQEIKGWIDNKRPLAHRGVPVAPKDILILVQSRGAVFQEVIRALRREGLPTPGADRLAVGSPNRMRFRWNR